MEKSEKSSDLSESFLFIKAYDKGGIDAINLFE